QSVGGGHFFVFRNPVVLGPRHQIELDDAPAGGAVIDRVVGDVVPRVERYRRVGRTDRHRQLQRPLGEIVKAYGAGEGGIDEWHDRFLGRRRGEGDNGIDGGNGRQTRIGILRRSAREDDDRCQVHYAAEKR